MRSTISLAAAVVACASVVVAQQNFTIDPNTVTETLRAEWCQAQFNSCGTLCGGETLKDTCDASTLKFECTCGNGTAPFLEGYSQTIPAFVCQRAYENCLAANPRSSQEQAACKTNIQDKCGKADPNKVVLPSASSSATTAPTGSSSTPSPTQSAKPAGAATLQRTGTGVMAVAIAAFAYLL